MKKVVLFLLLNILMIIFSFSVFAKGNKETPPPMLVLTIENNTGVLVTEIVVFEIDTNLRETYIRNFENNTTTEINIKKEVLYGIILIDINERQYAKNRQAWDTDTDKIVFARRDILDRNIWDKIIRVVLWPAYL